MAKLTSTLRRPPRQTLGWSGAAARGGGAAVAAASAAAVAAVVARVPSAGRPRQGTRWRGRPWKKNNKFKITLSSCSTKQRMYFRMNKTQQMFSRISEFTESEQLAAMYLNFLFHMILPKSLAISHEHSFKTWSIRSGFFFQKKSFFKTELGLEKVSLQKPAKLKVHRYMSFSLFSLSSLLPSLHPLLPPTDSPIIFS